MESPLSAQDYQFVQQTAQKRSGLHLGSGQEYLVSGRLQSLAVQQHFADTHALLTALRRQPGSELERRVVEALATHETFFFRDSKTHDYIRDVILPELLGRLPQGRRLRVWSAACSTGQEIYSLLMLLDEVNNKHPGASRLECEFIASDFSVDAVARAQQGIFADFDIRRGLSEAQRSRYFAPHAAGWQMRPEQRQRVRFFVHNLLDPFSRQGPVDLLLCRNVLIYFNDSTKRNIIGRLAEVMAKDGYLVLGNSETTLHLDRHFRPVDAGRVSILRPAEPIAAPLKRAVP